jgi:hypothetical protein
MKDGARSAIPDSECVCDNIHQWNDILIPADSEVKKFEMMFRKSDSCLFGLKLFDTDGKAILTCGLIDDPAYRSSSNAILQ